MKLLLDTHTALWFSGGDPRLSAKAREEIAATGNEKYVSIASLWEIAIKHSAGKFHLNEPIELFFCRDCLRKQGASCWKSRCVTSVKSPSYRGITVIHSIEF